MTRTYRQGAVGALFDEYERATDDLKDTISDIKTSDFISVIDKETEDPDCVSIQSIMNHVINAGYGYVYYIRKKFDDPGAERKKCKLPETAAEAGQELDEMMKYTVEALSNKYSITFDEILSNVFAVPWGQQYDFEQLMEHAIVHILRHRRQIEIFKLKIAQR